MSVEPFPRDVLSGAGGQAAPASAGGEPSRDFELYALARLLSHRLIGGWRAKAAPLSDELLQERLTGILALWNSGCPHAIDEGLLADLARRHPAETEAFRRTRRRNPAGIS
ncbi:hypothetical protein H2509_17985 [Stappia sp. F7233]|uniref:Uncharacterized protein n=1 Tax=Stappia albiluteola TaxID=2758565 RepID=A0A839AJD4_9HYPH|nr:hypothetical protein [Stappia albiluteola]MBA5779022.1 hypothetical protein [Stappia albiluteola]